MATETRVDPTDTAVLYCATVRTPIAPMHSEPGIASQMISQQLAGHHVDVIDEEGDWVCVTGEDGYSGWMHLGFLARAPQASARQSRQPSRVSLGCVTTDRGRRSPVASVARSARTGRIRRNGRGCRGTSSHRPLSDRRRFDHEIGAGVILLDELPLGRRDAVGRGLLGARANCIRLTREASPTRRMAAGRAW